MNEIFTGMSYADYEALPGERVSDLVHMKPTPAHFQAHKAAPRVSKPEFVIGHAVHTLVLEPHLFEDGYMVLPGDAPKRPTAKQYLQIKPSDAVEDAIDFWARIEAGEHAGKEILTAEDYAACVGMANSIELNQACQRYLSGAGYNEVVVTWTDPETGVVCKQRLDSLRSVNGGGLGLVDVKTAASAESGAFSASAERYGYFVKAGFYMHGMTVIGNRPDLFAWIVVEKTAPYLSAAYPISAAALWQGEVEARELLTSYARCKAANDWPGYPEEEISHPRWARRKEYYQW